MVILHERRFVVYFLGFPGNVWFVWGGNDLMRIMVYLEKIGLGYLLLARGSGNLYQLP